MIGRIRDEAARLLLALQFLTRLPVGAQAAPTPEAMAEAARYYPLVGALVGAAGAAVLLVAALALSVPVAVVLSIAATVVLTGALHEDGLADTFDGLGGGDDRERVLAIMRDSRIGTYGVLALVLVLAVKAGALAALPVGVAAAALVAGHAVSRLSSVLVIATGRYARSEGTGGFTAGGLSATGLAVAAATALVCLVGLGIAGGAGSALAAAVGGAVAGHLLARRVFEARLGGYTGDGLGAVQQLSEAGFYLGLAAWL